MNNPAFMTSISTNQFSDQFLQYTPDILPAKLAILDKAEHRRLCKIILPPPVYTPEDKPTTYIEWQNQQEAQLYIDPIKMEKNLKYISRIRATCFNWLHAITYRFNVLLYPNANPNMPCYTPDIYFRATQIADMYLSMHTCTSQMYRCICITALWIASKLEDIVPMSIYYAARQISGTTSIDLIQCESNILCTISNIAYPTIYTYYTIYQSQLETAADKDYLLNLLYVIAYTPQFCGMTPSAIVRQCITYVQKTAPINRIHIANVPTTSNIINHRLIESYYDIIVRT